jgi:phosphate transport system substrate-binding protein
MSAQNTGQTSPTPPTESLGAPPTRRRSGTMGTGIAIAIAIVLLLVGIGGGYFLGTSLNKSSTSTSTIDLTETGSSLLYPLFKNYWFPNYTAPNAASNVVLSAASTGSGTGQSDAESGLVNIGGSDAYVNSSVTAANNVVNFPVAISAQLIYYNLPAPLNAVHLNLNGSVLAQIYEGTITKWNDPMILAAQTTTVQGELNALTNEQIYTVKRSDSSGDTFLFTSYCYMSWSGFTYPASTSGLSGLSGTYVLTGDGNSGVVSTLHGQVGSIGYVGISYTASAAADGLEYAALGDNASLSASGGTNAANYILPTVSTISQDANLGLTRLNTAATLPNILAVSLILGGSWAGATTLVHGGGGTNATTSSPTPYPDVNLEYTLFKTAPSGNVVTSAALSATVVFMDWALSYGNYNTAGAPSTWISAVGFVPLTPGVIGYDKQILASIQP